MEQQHCNANNRAEGPLKLFYFIALWAMIDSEIPKGLKRGTGQKDEQ